MTRPTPPSEPDPTHIAAVAEVVRQLETAINRLDAVIPCGTAGPSFVPDLKYERRRLDDVIRRMTSPWMQPPTPTS